MAAVVGWRGASCSWCAATVTCCWTGCSCNPLAEENLVDRADLRLIAGADKQQQQPGWWQQQYQLQPQGLLRSAEQQEQHSTEKWVVYDSYQIQPCDSPTEVVSLGLQGVMMGSSS